MNTTKELAAVGSSPSSSAKESKPTVTANECCMCGDYGITSELYRCNLCSFRSQHRYCSNLYPKAETYELCNWCLRKDDGSIISTGHHEQQTSDKRSSQSRKTIMIKNNNPVRLKIQLRRCNSQILNNNNNNNDPVKKQKCLERLSSSSSLSSPSSSGAGRKNTNNNKTMTISNATEESESLIRRTKSEDISNSSSSSAGVVKQVFRGKARRYKLLEEVSS
ncbi:hypothetical protein C5167_010914 [Papaver somniferum]|uniref:PHD-type zinc finger plants domain-containing protein n=1 Tax=Papaver somniferum TaxID=3469 RepID=A0A4Y7K1L0_PAPSO|nr:probable serine/threonine-protein kinase roco9 [Papaver somniferum]RZC67224.1 hypothetical protein C5167_010914 [Papaver somniferum]